MFYYASASLIRRLHTLRKYTSLSKYSTLGKYDLDLKIQNVSLNNYINKIQEDYNKFNESGNLGANKHILPVGRLLQERNKIVDSLIGLDDLLKDPDDEIKQLAIEEQQQFEAKIKDVDEEILASLLPHDQDDFNEIVLEVSSGVGGQEAMLFAKEIFDMYCRFVEYKGWTLEMAEYQITELGGIRHATALITGQSVFKYFKHEAGVHRVQRTPATEKSGRIHTSTISVTALPQPSDIQININPRDLKIETKRSTGAGGQHVNTTDSAVRITHLPTNTTVECQVDRSQIKNRKMALAKLRAILYQKELDDQMEQTEATRKNQVRSNFRNEKIRTYNYNQDRITDHRLQRVNIHNLKGFLLGGEDLDNLIEDLDHQSKMDELLDTVIRFNK